MKIYKKIKKRDIQNLVIMRFSAFLTRKMSRKFIILRNFKIKMLNIDNSGFQNVVLNLCNRVCTSKTDAAGV